MGRKGEKHVSLTHAEKTKIHKWFNGAVPKPIQKDILKWIKREFGKEISRSTVSKMKLHAPMSDEFNQNPSFMSKKHAKFPKLDNVMWEWVLRMGGGKDT